MINSILSVLFILSIMVIIWAMVGYPLSIILIDKLLNPSKLSKNYDYVPSVTIMVVAHNEEKVIEDKIVNLMGLDYPSDKLSILVASDNSTDRTNKIVEKWINTKTKVNVSLYCSKEHKGKTNAQNEAQKTVTSEILVMTDANAILANDSITELTAAFNDKDVSYVTGRLSYINQNESTTSNSEASYWNLDLKIRDIESRLQTITAGNGALYACRNKEYVDFDPIESHDSFMPLYYALAGKKAKFNPEAIAFEKAGEVDNDEFKRKVRMNRRILSHIIPTIRVFNVFRYKWFSYFYFGHRTSRYLLWLSHLVLFITNLLLLPEGIFYWISFGAQILIYMMAALSKAQVVDSRYFRFAYYYVMTVGAQFKGVYNQLTGKSKPTWSKAESTR